MDTAELIRTAPQMSQFDYDQARLDGGITFFDGTPNGWLSNFHKAEIEVFDQNWQTSEHAYQAMKFESSAMQGYIRTAKSPGEAKYRGKTCKPIRKDWDTFKFQVMLDVIRAKFTQHWTLRNMLMQTGDVPLVEGNLWHDNIWGFCICNKCKGLRLKQPEYRLGLNALGHTLMIVRSELLQTQSADKFTYNEGDVEITSA